MASEATLDLYLALVSILSFFFFFCLVFFFFFNAETVGQVI